MKITLLVLRFCKSKKNFIFGFAAATGVAFLIICFSAYPPTGISRDTSRSQPDFLNPPGLNVSEFRPTNMSNAMELQMLSETVQSQIRSLQDSTNCGNNAIMCGHPDKYCGFGCHIHHRAACLMISYAMGLPLIHETEIDGGIWAFSTPWSEVMLPLGSACNTTYSTYKWTWHHSAGFYSRPQSTMKFAWNPLNSKQPDKLDFPLFDGIVAARHLAEKVEKLHPDPLLWWASQFVQYTMRIQPKTMKKIRKEQFSIGLRRDCIGLHIRRTDKITEAKDSFHDLNDYFSKVIEINHKASRQNRSKSQVFIASDDSSVLSTSKERYKDWEIVGFDTKKTLRSPSERKNYLYEVLRDTLSLALCDTVICGLSSNICRLLLEMQTGSKRRLISLERSYSYIVLGVTLKTQINKLSYSAIHQVHQNEVE